MKLLHVDSSILRSASVSRQLSAEIVRALVERHPESTVDHLDLALEPPDHFGADALGIRVPQGEATAAQRRENAVSERLVSQFLAADVIVVGAPFYNFAIPTQLKAWIDRLAQAGRTFRYTESGPVGLAGGRTVIVASARGGVYSSTAEGRAADHQESYLETVFGFFGIDDVRIVRAEGVAMGEASRAAAIGAARAAIGALGNVDRPEASSAA